MITLLNGHAQTKISVTTSSATVRNLFHLGIHQFHSLVQFIWFGKISFLWTVWRSYLIFVLSQFYPYRYMQVRIPKLKTTLLIPTLQCMCLVWAFLCGLSRITDHRHHWWDVLTGMIIGIIFAVLTVNKPTFLALLVWQNVKFFLNDKLS